MAYILYKAPVQLETLSIVQYLHSLGKLARPLYCIERSYPGWVHRVPSIETSSGDKYIGIDECVEYYEQISGVDDILQKALEFKRLHPRYTIT